MVNKNKDHSMRPNPYTWQLTNPSENTLAIHNLVNGHQK